MKALPVKLCIVSHAEFKDFYMHNFLKLWFLESHIEGCYFSLSILVASHFKIHIQYSLVSLEVIETQLFQTIEITLIL